MLLSPGPRLSVLRCLLLGSTLLLGTCSAPEKKPAAPGLRPGPGSREWILREVYSGKHCFVNRYASQDSAQNEQDICLVRKQFRDTVNGVRVDYHNWSTRKICDKNNFAVIQQGSHAWFVPFCDQLGRRWQDDTAFFRTNLAVAGPLNEALHSLALHDRPRFVAGLLDRFFSPNGRLTRRNYATLEDARTRAYLQALVGRPNRYYYHSERHTLKEAVWEFDDTHPNDLRVRVIQAGRYKCFEY